MSHKRHRRSPDRRDCSGDKRVKLEPRHAEKLDFDEVPPWRLFSHQVPLLDVGRIIKSERSSSGTCTTPSPTTTWLSERTLLHQRMNSPVSHNEPLYSTHPSRPRPRMICVTLWNGNQYKCHYEHRHQRIYVNSKGG
ncbi:hypothetical protein MN608_04364 [Microdochium nivale]|nr:hypothetical protein MN608_04364 [Microdochium nivale]